MTAWNVQITQVVERNTLNTNTSLHVNVESFQNNYCWKLSKPDWAEPLEHLLYLTEQSFI